MRKKFLISVILIICLIISNIITYTTLSQKIKILEKEKAPVIIEIINDLPEPEPEIEDAHEPIVEEPIVEETIAHKIPAPTSLATMIAKVVWGEARGLGQTEQSCVVWTILNRADAWGKSVESIITSPNQFYYDPSFPTIDDHGRDITVMVQEILNAWESGDNSIRTLPENYFFYVGDGYHNYFYADYNNPVYWDYSYGTPYSD